MGMASIDSVLSKIRNAQGGKMTRAFVKLIAEGHRVCKSAGVKKHVPSSKDIHADCVATPSSSIVVPRPRVSSIPISIVGLSIPRPIAPIKAPLPSCLHPAATTRKAGYTSGDCASQASTSTIVPVSKTMLIVINLSCWFRWCWWQCD
eukprot:c20866_g1_i1.p2 GENE.c20866_g1_i1~~c20866_g1_i1.p2  ORF type:complete len:148 (+),score=16.89 c20866_g1_i1:533-976(+)